MKTKTSRWPLFACAVIFTGAAIFGVSRWLKQNFDFDMGDKPPHQVFTRIFQIPVPPNVRAIKVAGEAHLSGIFWMRIETDNVNAVVRALKRNAKIPLKATNEPPDMMPPLSEIKQSQYAAAVNWSAALKIVRPEWYEFETVPQGTGWVGVVVVDRAQKVIYAQGGLM